MKLALISPRGKILNRTTSEFEKSYEYNLRFGGTWSGLSPGVLTVAALTPADFEIEVIDENVEEIDFSKRYDLVGISFMTQQAVRACMIADQFRENGTFTVAGGIHATVLPEEAAEHFDSVIVGEAECLWPQFIEDFQTGKAKRIYRSEETADLKDSPVPRYDLIKEKEYEIIWLQSTRGCPHDCEFCAASTAYGKKYRTKSLDQVLAEIDLITELFGNDMTIGFGDDNLFANRKFSVALLEKLSAKKVKWVAQCDISLGEKAELLSLLKTSGCSTLFIGLESVSEKNLKGLDRRNWKLRQLENYSKNLHAIQSRGVAVMASFIFGLENDDATALDDIKRFLIDNNIYASNISLATPYPGTRLRARLAAENRILPTTWDNYTIGDVNIVHPNITKDQFEKALTDFYKDLNSPAMHARRMEYMKNVYRQLLKETS